MGIEKPGRGRSRIESTADGLRIVIPTKRGIAQIGIIIFMCAWMGGWLVGEVTVIMQLLAGGGSVGGRAFMIFWLVGWTVGGAFVTYIILWNLAGREIITFSLNTLRLERTVFDFGLKKLYAISDIKGLRVQAGSDSPFSWTWSMQFYGMGGGKLAFDYGLKTVRFAYGVDEAEAKHIIEQINNRGLSLSNS